MGTNKPEMNTDSPSIKQFLQKINYECLETKPRGLQVLSKLRCCRHNKIFSISIYSLQNSYAVGGMPDKVCPDCFYEKAKETIDKGIIWTRHAHSDYRIAEYLFNKLHKYDHTLLGYDSTKKAFQIKCNKTNKVFYEKNIRKEVGSGKCSCSFCAKLTEKEKGRKIRNAIASFYYIDENNRVFCKNCGIELFGKKPRCKNCFPKKPKNYALDKSTIKKKKLSRKRIKERNLDIKNTVLEVINKKGLGKLYSVITKETSKIHIVRYVDFKIVGTKGVFTLDLNKKDIIRLTTTVDKNIRYTETKRIQKEGINMGVKLTELEKINRAITKAKPFKNIKILNIKNNILQYKCIKHNKIFNRDFTKYMQAKYPCDECKKEVIGKNISNSLIKPLKIPKTSILEILDSQYLLPKEKQLSDARKYGVLTRCKCCGKKQVTTRPALKKNNYRCPNCQPIKDRTYSDTRCNQWLGELQKILGITIQGYYSRERTTKINDKVYKLDGFHKDSNTIFEFLGDYWHDYNGEGEKYSQTFSRLGTLSKRYNIVYVWEHDYLEGKLFSGVMGSTLPLFLNLKYQN